jgi:hypothetical protein
MSCHERPDLIGNMYRHLGVQDECTSLHVRRLTRDRLEGLGLVFCLIVSKSVLALYPINTQYSSLNSIVFGCDSYSYVDHGV